MRGGLASESGRPHKGVTFDSGDEHELVVTSGVDRPLAAERSLSRERVELQPDVSRHFHHGGTALSIALQCLESDGVDRDQVSQIDPQHGGVIADTHEIRYLCRGEAAGEPDQSMIAPLDDLDQALHSRGFRKS